MPWPLLFKASNHLDTTSNSIETSIDIDNKHEEEEEEEQQHQYNWHGLTIEEHNSILTRLNRIGAYWRQIIFDKLRFILTLIVFSMINIATRLTCFRRQRTLVRSTSPLSSVVTSPTNRTFQEDINHSSVSLIEYNSQLDLPSLEGLTMARILVPQQSLRTPSINIHRTTSTLNNNLIPLSHSVDERIFSYNGDTKDLFQIFQRFASEPQMSMYHSPLNDSYIKTPTFYLSSNTDSQINEPEIDNIDGDQFEPVTTETTNSEQLDNILTATPIIEELDEDIILNTNSSLSTERPFRRRKRRPSLTRTSSSSDDTEPLTTDFIEKVDNNNNIHEKSQEISENLQPVPIESLSLNETNGDKSDTSVENEQSNDKIPPTNCFPRRRLRYRSYRQTLPTSDESISENTPELSSTTEVPIATPPSSPTSPSVNVPSSPTNTNNTLPSKLKRNGSSNTVKKMVRFADSVGRELAQVQYIRSLTDQDELDDLLLTKSNLYIPKTFNFEHKPWSFDIALTSKQIPDTRIPKRFFCLFRQPNSEHPDIYLHDIWKSQIKLEHAEVRSKSSLTGEQYLDGTIWVTNASYWKQVTIKYSFNRWLNTYEYDAQHRCHSNDFRNIDQFEFSIGIPHDIDRIDFVLCYRVNGQEYWDNNEGKNYTLETERASTPQTTISLPHDCDLNEMRFY